MHNDIENEYLFTSTKTEEELQEFSLRPRVLDEYIGQKALKENLKVYMSAARKRGEPLDHVLLYGPAGLGKTTLAHIIAHEMGASCRITSGPTIEKAADLAAILTALEDGDVLFIDEIHRMNKNIEEVLYPAMEDFALDFMVGKGPSARSVRLPLKRFTLVGATTRAGMLSSPLRDRFGMAMRLEMYEPDELSLIVKRSAGLLNSPIEANAALEIGKRSRGTPRIANRLLKRVRDFATQASSSIDMPATLSACKAMDIDELGLDKTDRNMLSAIIKNFAGGPVGLSTLAAFTGEDKETIEDVYEPYLMQLKFIAKTAKGRIALEGAYQHMGVEMDDKR